MCVGIPMQIIAMDGGFARCSHLGAEQLIDMSLVGEQPAGTWLMTFMHAAREVIDADTARSSLAALEAVSLVMSGAAGPDDIGALFADLVDREPQLPEFLRNNTPALAKEAQ